MHGRRYIPSKWVLMRDAQAFGNKEVFVKLCFDSTVVSTVCVS